MRAGRTAATSPVNSGFHFDIQDCGGEVGRNIEGDTPLRDDDWVTLAIGDDGGYEFVSIRTIGIFHGKGTFTLIDGKLRTETERGWAQATLYEDGVRRMIKIEGATKDGTQYSAELAPTK